MEFLLTVKLQEEIQEANLRIGDVLSGTVMTPNTAEAEQNEVLAIHEAKHVQLLVEEDAMNVQPKKVKRKMIKVSNKLYMIYYSLFIINYSLLITYYLLQKTKMNAGNTEKPPRNVRRLSPKRQKSMNNTDEENNAATGTYTNANSNTKPKKQKRKSSPSKSNTSILQEMNGSDENEGGEGEGEGEGEDIVDLVEEDSEVDQYAMNSAANKQAQDFWWTQLASHNSNLNSVGGVSEQDMEINRLLQDLSKYNVQCTMYNI